MPTDSPAPQLGLSIAALILAAGHSSRMGRPKLLLPWRETTILGHLVALWRSLGINQLGVVYAKNDDAILRELQRLHVPPQETIFNPAPERGMFSSLQCAAGWSGWKSNLTHWVIVLGDQPHLRPEKLKDLLTFSAKNPSRICQPAWGGQGRHPVILPASIFAMLPDSDAPTFREFLRGYEIALCPLDDPGLALDIDSPGDYQRLFRPEAP
jgi:molybdenum cofactor cytidylyltransferase